MNAVTEASEMDLEKCTEEYEEDEIKLPEDQFAGKLIFFFSMWVFSGWVRYDALFGLFGAEAGLFVGIVYVSVRSTLFYSKEPADADLPLDVFPSVWLLIINYFLGFCFFGLYRFTACERLFVAMDQQEHPILLPEVSEADLIGDPMAWRRIAFKSNRLFAQMGKRYVPFYSGDHCKSAFEDGILIPVESHSYENLWHEGSSLNVGEMNMLLERAVANYRRVEAPNHQSSQTGDSDDEATQVEDSGRSSEVEAESPQVCVEQGDSNEIGRGCCYFMMKFIGKFFIVEACLAMLTFVGNGVFVLCYLIFSFIAGFLR